MYPHESFRHRRRRRRIYVPLDVLMMLAICAAVLVLAAVLWRL